MKEKTSISENKVMSYIRPLAFGVLFGTIIIILLFLLFSFIIVQFKIPAETISLIVILCAAAGAFFGGVVSSRMFGRKGLIIGVFNGLIFAAILMLTSAMFSNQFLTGENITKHIIMVIASMIGGIVGVNFKKSKR